MKEDAERLYLFVRINVARIRLVIVQNQIRGLLNRDGHTAHFINLTAFQSCFNRERGCVLRVSDVTRSCVNDDVLLAEKREVSTFIAGQTATRSTAWESSEYHVSKR